MSLKIQTVGADRTLHTQDGSALVVVCDCHNNPVVLVTEIAPGVEKILTAAHDPEEFSRALVGYGIRAGLKVKEVRI